MEMIMGTTEAGQKLREHVGVFMAALPIPQSTPAGEPPQRREDGVVEFYKNWLVRGTGSGQGLSATYSDNDDVIEFGLSERHDGGVLNILQATLVLAEDGGELNVISEANPDLNFDAIVNPDKSAGLEQALRYFRDILLGE
jgi:hypothetical protein